MVKLYSPFLVAYKLQADSNAKLLFVVYVGFQVTLLLLSGIPVSGITRAYISLKIGGYTFLLGISFIEHMRSVRPSTLLIVYLGASIASDLLRVRVLFIFPHTHVFGRVLPASFFTRTMIFALEIIEKRSLLLDQWKDVSAEATGSVLNRALFFWLNNLFLRGYRTLLTVETLPSLDGELLSASDPTKLIDRWKHANKTSRNSLLWTFMSHYRRTFFAGVLPRLACTSFAFVQPFLIQRVLDYTEEKAAPNTDNSAYVLIFAYAIVYIGLSLTNAVYQQKSLRLLTLFRGSLITLIYDKTLRIDSSLIAEAEPITLMSADIDRIDSSMLILHDLYAGPIEGALSLWLLYRLLGVALVAPVIWIIVCLIAALPLANAAGKAQTPWLEAIEKRLAATAKALSAMKAIKMTGLTETVSFKVASLRLSEIRASRRHRVLTTFVMVAYFVCSALAPIWGFAVYIVLAKANNSETLTEGLAFAALSLFELLNHPLQTIIHGLEDIRTVVNSFQRIQEYLDTKEREDHRTKPNITSLRMNSSFEGSQANDDIALQKFSTVNLASSQFAVTVKDASVGYSPEGDPILKKVNFEIPRGKITMIYGSVGSGKSTTLKLLLGEMPFTGGSVSTSFSRAAYCPQSPWITWGTTRSNIVGTSAWDRQWYDRVVHACALSTDFEAYANGDQTQSGARGSRLSGGQRTRVSLARALYSRNPIMILDDVLAGLDWATERHILDTVFAHNGLFKQLDCTVILATNSANHLKFAQNTVFLDKNGQKAYQYVPESVPLALEADPRLPNPSLTLASQLQPDLPYEILLEAERLENPVSDASRHTGDMKIYAYYAKTVGWWAMSAYLFACAVFVFGDIFPSVWLQWWTNANVIHSYSNIGYWLGVYVALAVVIILSCTFSDCVLNLSIVPKASRKFHEFLLHTTMRAPISFFTSIETGTTLNRFSQDLDLIDNDLPMSIDQTIWTFLSAIVSAALIFLGASYVATAVPVCILAFALIQLYYLKTSRQLRLLDIEAKAPLYSQFLETVDGIMSIRAYGWMQNYLENSYNNLNTSQKPYYLLGCGQRWLTLVLDLFNAGIAILVVSVAISTQNRSTQLIGVALFNIVTFNSSLQNLVTEWTHLETALKAINRIRSYVSNVKDENLACETNKVPENWPAHGVITFQDVDASYNPSMKPILEGINLSIKKGEKLAICGRTGSGKTSLVGVLLRLLEIESGTIYIDGIDISTISRQEIRRKFSTLPQEPFFFQGSVRESIDAFSMASNERVIEVLRAVCMWEYYESRGGLEAKIDEEKLSDGQRQLVCLARAIIKPGRILLLDEATSKVDADTDALMQRVLRKECQGRTVISTVHRLNTVCDYDRVILLDKGRIIEIGKPQELLATSTSALRALYDNQIS